MDDNKFDEILDNPAAKYVYNRTVGGVINIAKNRLKDLVVSQGTYGLGSIGPRPFRRSTDIGEETITDNNGNQITYYTEPSELFGLPVHNRLVLSFDKIDFDGRNITSNKEEVIFDDAIITISKSKNIIRTYLPGYNGSIKEHMYDDDISINFKATIAFNGPMKYNKDKIIKASKILSYPDEIDISNDYLNECFNINKIDIIDFEIRQSEQFSNIVELNINAISHDGFSISVSY